MNPPSALYGAMNKDRKPFTYTPGGLDLSEIKSERMAKRLMRNAMSQGVPETPAQTTQTSTTPIAPGTLPNFNCLPVQVFPTFQLPANPKSLLRTRSNPDGPKDPDFMLPKSSFIADNHTTDSWKEINKPLTQMYQNNSSTNNKPTPSYDYTILGNDFSKPEQNCGSYCNTDVFLPEKSYEAEYFQVEPQGPKKLIENSNSDKFDNICRQIDDTKPQVYNPNILLKNYIDSETIPVTLSTTPSQEIEENNYEKKEVKIVKKQTKAEKESDENGNTEAAVVVRLPTKSSAAKTETQVEVVKKILPDGTIEEVKTTTTKTTVDGKTEITTKTETRTIPKETSVEVEEVEEEEEEGESENVVVEENENEEDVAEESKSLEKKESETIRNEQQDQDENEEEEVSEKTKTEVKTNGHIITGEEKLETSTTKKVVVTQSVAGESEEEIEEEAEEEEEEEEGGNVDVEEVVIIKKTQSKQNENAENEIDEDNDDVENNATTTDELESRKEEVEQEDEVEEDEAEEEVEESEKPGDKEEAENIEKEAEPSDVEDQVQQNKEAEDTVLEDNKLNEQCEEEEVEEEYEEAEDSQKKVEVQEKIQETPVEEAKEININIELEVEKDNNAAPNEKPIADSAPNKENEKQQVNESNLQSEPKVVSFREPSIPFEKVEDVEIKPIGPAQEIIKKSHTEIITTTTDKPAGALSTQTEYNRIENIVTVNRTAKTLDHAYEQTQQTIPTIKTYFSPITNDRILSTPQPISRPYQPVYPPEPQTERRHSLLLERLSVDRQIPTSDIYQNNYQNSQSYEQSQWSEEPQSEVLILSNVKPSTITKNQQWYQQSQKENVLSNTVSPTPVLPSQIWSQKNQAQNLNQQQATPVYQLSQQQYTPKPEFQSTYVENVQNTYKSNTNNLHQNAYPSYTPKPSWVSSTFDSKPAATLPSNQFSSIRKESTESFQKSTQQFNSSYVPPPWEQDSSYITENQNYYQPPSSTVSYAPSTNQTWKPKPPPSKFSKPTPTAYIPPAPNQSFVKPVVDTPKVSGRKTYYSEYERRYISVPESTYIPNESKFPAQPDPSPQYYYDNNEPTETVEPQWRKELREFTEKTSQTTTQTETTSIRPPWEEDPKYAAPSEYVATVTPSWTQTLRPRSWRERSYEPEYVGSKEWPKTNTLGRGRPQSSYVKSNVDTILERPRGVSVDRYNPNNYQAPLSSEHPPVPSHTLNPNIHPKIYHNPNVPAYHARASAEPREQTTAYLQQRVRADTRAPPVQSRSFKYLQWITGTED